MKRTKVVTAKTSRIIAWAVLRDYLYYLSDTKRIVVNNFLAGLCKGTGSAIGFSLLSALIIWFVTFLASRNLPIIGEFLQSVADMIRYKFN